MNAVLNLLRVCGGVVWTAAVALPLDATIWLTYLFGRIAAVVGAHGLLDEILTLNVAAMNFVARRLWAPVILRICEIRVRVVEEVPIDWSANHVICANHASIFDIVALAAAVPPPFRFVAKRELLRWPVIGWSLIPSGQIVIDRHDRGSAVRQLQQDAVRRMHSQVIFFVEGTRSPDGKLMPFKKGAFHFAVEHGLDTVPTTVRGSFGVLGRTAWWRIHPGRDIEIRFGRPLRPLPGGSDESDRARAADLLERTRAAIVRDLESI